MLPDNLGEKKVKLSDVIDGLQDIMSKNIEDDEIDTWIDLHAPEPSWGCTHDMSIEGGLAITIRGSVRIKLKYSVSVDLDEDIANVPLMQTICGSDQSIIINTLSIVLESEMDMLDSCGADITSAPTVFPHAASSAILIAARTLVNMQSCLNLLMRVRMHYQKEELMAVRSLDKLRQAAASTLKTNKLLKQQTGSAPAAVPAHVQARMRDEENARVETVKAKTLNISQLTKVIKDSMDNMVVVVRACLQVATVLEERHDEEEDALTEVLVSDRQIVPKVSSMKQAREARRLFVLSCCYLEQNYFPATGQPADFNWKH